jgi:hypothetical protein
MSVREARRLLIAAGHGATLAAAAQARPGWWAGAGSTEQLEHLAEIAAYIDDGDPLMIGAAFLLEQMGYERGREQLRLDLGAIAAEAGAERPPRPPNHRDEGGPR